ncbi:hypothetical protein JW877_05310, partial [bacterium]|nr:hypothetical protein [bacterium]
FYISADILKQKRFLLFSFLGLAILIIVGMTMNLVFKTYEPLNLVDFLTLLIKIGISIMVLHNIIRENIRENVEVIFILMGLLLFFVMQLFNSILVLQDHQNNWYITLLAPILAYTFWGSSTIWIHRFKYKYSW